ncbi:MAG: hypothetical protein CM15mP59_3580 [Flavobacteriaceae bacterium]|nr:MAG: hypothetical protein CM15mP59_3580 [Flavobacteriaceae bacterium]
MGSAVKGRKSPKHLITTTFADQLRLHTQFRNKVNWGSLKDRSAILSTGHSANAPTGLLETKKVFLQQAPTIWILCQNGCLTIMTKNILTIRFICLEHLKTIDTYSASGPDDTPMKVYLKGSRTTNIPL